MEYRVAHAKAFVQANGLERFYVIGNSQGGYIAARLALEHHGVGAFITTTSGSLAPKGAAESQALAKKHGEELKEYTPSMENMRKLTLGTIFNNDLVTEESVRERYGAAGEGHSRGSPPIKDQKPSPVGEQGSWSQRGTGDFALRTYSGQRIPPLRQLRALGPVGSSCPVQPDRHRFSQSALKRSAGLHESGK